MITISWTTVAACVVPIGWMLASSALILLNKYLMVDKGFHYPMVLSGLGQVVSSLGAVLSCRLLHLPAPEKTVSLHMFTTRMLPVGLCNAVTLMGGNAVYMFLSVSLIQMFKAFTPVFTMIGLAVFALEHPTRPLVASVIIIALGTALAGYGTIGISATGVLLQAVAELAEAARLIMTQTLLQHMSFHPIEGMMYLAPASVLWMGAGALLLEVPAMAREDAMRVATENAPLMLVAASLGFVVTSLAFGTIKLCGSLTLKVLSTVKNTAIVFFSVAVLSEHVSPIQMVGYTISLAGFIWYQSIKSIMPKKEVSTSPCKQGLLTSHSRSNSGSANSRSRAVAGKFGPRGHPQEEPFGPLGPNGSEATRS